MHPRYSPRVSTTSLPILSRCTPVIQPASLSRISKVLAGFVLSHNSSEYNLDTIIGMTIGSGGLLPEGQLPAINGPGIAALRDRLFGTEDQEVAYRKSRVEWVRLSKEGM